VSDEVVGYFHDYDGVAGNFFGFYDFSYRFAYVFMFGEALVEVVAPHVGVYEYHFCFTCFSVGSHIFLSFRGSIAGVSSVMQPSSSLMNSSGEIGGIMMMCSFSIFSRAFPPACNPTLSRIFFGIKTLPLLSTVNSLVFIFPTNISPTVGKYKLCYEGDGNQVVFCWGEDSCN